MDGVGVGIDVALRVAVGVDVGTLVFVEVGVALAVAVGALVGVEVAVTFGLTVGVDGLTSPCDSGVVVGVGESFLQPITTAAIKTLAIMSMPVSSEVFVVILIGFAQREPI